jgi:hypothetical protein
LAEREASFDIRARRCEEALLRSVAAVERLKAIAALAFGTPVLKILDVGAVEFRVDGRELKKQLRSLARQSSAARAVEAAWVAYEHHEALVLRHSLAHKLPTTAAMESLVVLEEEYVGTGPAAWFEHRYLVGARVIGSSIEAEPLLKEAIFGTVDLYGGILDMARALAELVAERATLLPPRLCVFRWSSEAGRYVLESVH